MLLMVDRAKEMVIRDSEGTVPMVAVANVLRAVHGRAPPEAICDEVGIDLAQLHEHDARMPYRQLADLYDAAARWTGDPSFGLRVGARVDARNFELMGYLALTTASLEQAFEVLARYMPLWTTEARFRIERSQGTFEVLWAYADPSAARRHDSEMSIMAAISMGGLLAAGRWRPREVHFRHSPPDDTSEHVRLLRAPVRFGMPHDKVVCDTVAGLTPFASADPGLHKLLRDLAEQRLAIGVTQPSTVEETAAAIAKLLPTGDAQLACVARMLRIGARTLQRRLIAAGTTFATLLAAVRRNQATHALVHSDIPIGEIARRLGYGSTSELHRAFRSWFGVGPAAYRRARR